MEEEKPKNKRIRNTGGKKENAGRKEKPIDWGKVEDLLIAGCNATEIAPHFNLYPQTFCDRVQKRFGMYFTEYAAIFQQKGVSILRKVQFNKAVKGDNSMLIWLGKNRLKQSDNPQEVVAPLDQILESDNENMELKARLLKAEQRIEELLKYVDESKARPQLS